MLFPSLHWVKRGKNIRKRGDWCPGLRAVQILLSPEILGWLQEELIQQEYPRDPGRMERLGSCVLCLKRLLPSLAIFNDSPPSWWSLVFSWKTHGCVSYLEPKGKTKWPNRKGIFHFPISSLGSLHIICNKFPVFCQSRKSSINQRLPEMVTNKQKLNIPLIGSQGGVKES